MAILPALGGSVSRVHVSQCSQFLFCEAVRSLSPQSGQRNSVSLPASVQALHLPRCVCAYDFDVRFPQLPQSVSDL